MTSAAPNSNLPSHPPIQINSAASPPNKRDLKSWWKGFKLPSKHQETHEHRPQGIFGVPLRQSITYANVAISLIDERGKSYIYGYVPIVVAKCGVFLKEKATGVEGIFRLSGSEKRIKELKTVFDSPDRYGKGLVWDGYTVHDAANVLRRYLNDLPEPVVPLDLYEKFREPLRGATKQAVGDVEGPQFIEQFNEMSAIEEYQRLITELPPLNRQLLLYILDLLAVFAAKADENRMNSQNLAAIFQPGMLSHPAHAMAPEEYRLNQCVIIFLIENQDHFLIGMQGTAADEKTKKEVESGPASNPITPNPKRNSSLGRSASNASAGANSVRRDGKVRRNRSVSSRNSKTEGSSTPNSPALTATPTTGGLARSNTVPSKKSPALVGGRFQRHDGSNPHSPAHLEPLTQLNSGESIDQSNHSSFSHETPSSLLTPSREPAIGRSQERLLEVPDPATPSKSQNLPSIFQRSPTDTNDKRQPNKLKKKRIPGSLNQSAHSSSASLQHSQPNATSPGFEIQNPLEQAYHKESDSQLLQQHPLPPPIKEERQQEQLQDHQLTPPTTLIQQKSDVSSEHTPRASQASSNPSLHPENTLKAKKSPPTSLHSSFNEGSDLDQVLEDQSLTTSEQAEKEKKRRWRLSRSRNADNGTGSGVTSPRLGLGSNDNADISSLSISSSSHRPRKSESSDPTMTGFDAHAVYDSGRDKDEPKGPIGWIRNKYREAKETAEQRRNKSPPADRPTLSSSFLPRGKSLDIKREGGQSEKQTVPPSVEHTQAPAPTPTSPPGTAPAPTPTLLPATVPAPPPVSAPPVSTVTSDQCKPPQSLQEHQQEQPPVPTIPNAPLAPVSVPLQQQHQHQGQEEQKANQPTAPLQSEKLERPSQPSLQQPVKVEEQTEPLKQDNLT
ncbi:GTPase activating protein (GAP) for Rho1p [Neonectria magnoliae]|uniref:GTPase activating protein (GAP) for Rho1p n=1 Tax=Neonectria magnoliae TaxID=2732573 RepID=A0ABR1I7D4_9HYPO